MEDMADKALKDVYDLFSIDHILHARTQRTAAGPSPLDPLYRTIFGSAATPALIASFTPSLGSGGVMPLLTRKGFVDIMSLEILYDPSKQWGNMSRLLRKYDLPAYRGWGDLPRSVLPEYPDQRSIQRVKMASAASQAKLEQLQASLQIRARGRQNALDLIDGPRYRYTYY
jgi:hypothetical protein